MKRSFSYGMKLSSNFQSISVDESIEFEDMDDKVFEVEKEALIKRVKDKAQKEVKELSKPNVKF